MNENLPSITPSLANAFEPERQELQLALTDDLSTAQMVGEARRALDRAGAAFSASTQDKNYKRQDFG